VRRTMFAEAAPLAFSERLRGSGKSVIPPPQSDLVPSYPVKHKVAGMEFRMMRARLTSVGRMAEHRIGSCRHRRAVRSGIVRERSYAAVRDVRRGSLGCKAVQASETCVGKLVENKRVVANAFDRRWRARSVGRGCRRGCELNCG
jgi:hypothetical protein